jgi:hypothetical protein
VIESRKMSSAGHVGTGDFLYRVLEGKLEGKRSLGRPRPKWEYY